MTGCHCPTPEDCKGPCLESKPVYSEADRLKAGIEHAIAMCRDLSEDPPVYWEIADFLEELVTGKPVVRGRDGQRT